MQLSGFPLLYSTRCYSTDERGFSEMAARCEKVSHIDETVDN